MFPFKDQLLPVYFLAKNIWLSLNITYDILIFENEKTEKRDVTQNRAKVKSAYHQSKNLFQEKNCNFDEKICHMSHYLYSITFCTSGIIKNSKYKLVLESFLNFKKMSCLRIVLSEILTKRKIRTRVRGMGLIRLRPTSASVPGRPSPSRAP